jgi:capsular exopolysaccharide synthesis family protein
MGSRALLGAVRRRWRWVAAATVLGMLSALVWSLMTPPTYRSTSSVFFSLKYGDSASELVQGSTYTQNQVASFTRLVSTPAVLAPAITVLGLDTTPAELARRVEARSPIDTVIIEVSVTDGSAGRSAAIADAIVASLSQVVEDVAPENELGRPTVRATTVAPAEVPESPASPNIPVNVVAGLVGGLLLGVAVAVVRDGLDNRVRDAEVAAEVTSVPVVGVIPARTRRNAPEMVVEAAPHSPHAEAFRHLRTNLQFLGIPSGASGGQVVTVTSSLASEGKSTVAANLAAALAETGLRVLLVDADLRRPALAGLLGVEGAAGLTDVLIGRADVADVVQEWGSHGLRFLASGAIPPNPSELLGSPAMSVLLDELRTDYDHVVLDTAPLLPVADAVILSRLVDGTLVLANVTSVRRPQLAASLRALEQVTGRVLGIVLNQVVRADATYAYERREDPTRGSAAPEAAAPTRSAPAVSPARIVPPITFAPDTPPSVDCAGGPAAPPVRGPVPTSVGAGGRNPDGDQRRT